MINAQELLSRHLILITILVILGYSLSASAHPEMPHTFYGYIPDASDGQIVTATVNNISISSIVLEGWYVNLDVPADDPDTLELEGGRNGDIIYFSVDGQPVGSYIFNIGGINRLEIYNNTSESNSDGSISGSSRNRDVSGNTFESIELTETDRKYINKDEKVSFIFVKPGNVITFLNFTSLTNAGQITAHIDVFKSTSTPAGRSPSGKIYKHVNIWVGKYGNATDQYINDCIIGFKVRKEWVNENQINVKSIRLTRYYMDAWNDLLTYKVSEDDEYLYYKAETSGFSSPFAITGSNKITITPSQLSEKIENIGSAVPSSIQQDAASSEKSTPIPGFEILISIFCLLILSYKY